MRPINSIYAVLDMLPCRVASAIIEVHNKTGAPLELVILVAISAMSTALHGVVIRTPNGRLMPISLYCLGIGPPVCGKSAVMWEFYKEIRKFDVGLGKRRAGGCELASHPALRDVLQLDVTSGSLLEELVGSGIGLTIADDDCSDLLRSDLMKKRGRLNRLFDGAVKESLARRDHEALVSYAPSLGICCFTQPDIYTDHQVATRGADRKSGLAGRFLYAYTSDGIGSCVPNLLTPSLDEINTLGVQFLDQRVQRLLAGNTERIEVRLSAEAESLWADIRRGIDHRSDFQWARDSAGRATEKTWRIAAALHCFNMASISTSPAAPTSAIPDIPAEMVEAAWAFVEWSIQQFCEVFPPPTPKQPKVSRVKERQLEEAREAKRHLYNHLRGSQSETMPWTFAQELSFLSVHKFRTVVAHMKSTHQVEVLGGKDPILRFTPRFFDDMGYKSSAMPGAWSV